MRSPHIESRAAGIAAAVRVPNASFAARLARLGASAAIAVSVLTAAGCACPPKKAPPPAQEPVAREPAPESRIVVREETGHPYVLTRPNLPADWNWNGQALPTGDVATSVIAVEKFTPGTVNLNSEYEYTVRVTSLSRTMHLSDVAVTDHLPTEGYTFSSAEPAGERSGDSLVWRLGHLAPGEVREMTVRGRATSVGSVRKCATVEYTPRVCVETAVVAPALELTRTAPQVVVMCDDIPLRYVVRNPGSGDAVAVKVTDQLPDGLTVDGSRTVSFDVGTLKSGESRELAAVARATKTGKFESRAEAIAEGELRSEAPASVVVQQPKLEIVAEAMTASQLLGRDSRFRVTVRNTGDCAAKDFVLRNVISGAEKIVAASDGGQIADSQVSWQLGALEAGDSREFMITVNRAAEGLVTHEGTASAYCADAVTASAKTTYHGIPAVLVEVVDDVDPLPIGATTKYTVTITNQGTSADFDLVVTCGFEDAVEFVSADGTTKAVRTGPEVKFAPLAQLAPKESARWTVEVRGLKEADSRFRVSVQTRGIDRPVDETEATRVFKFDF